ncbi:VWA-like domain-containing protein [Tersicoccus sp. MR15.9]|uniref:vWA domain-containing protein n=1 Tax=Tersicoccus mangrovi TaxID=3121635 RepID=UPI002FE55009
MRLAPLTPDQLAHLQAWRWQAVEKMPYLATLLHSLRPVATTAVDTFAVDKHYRLYVNFDRCIAKGPQFCSEGLLHEAFHLVADHAAAAAQAGVTPDEAAAWNVASDAAINDDLRDAGCDLLAAHGVLPARLGEPDYQTVEHYMAKLRALMAKQAERTPPPVADDEAGNDDADPSADTETDDPDDQPEEDESGQDDVDDEHEDDESDHQDDESSPEDDADPERDGEGDDSESDDEPESDASDEPGTGTSSRPGSGAGRSGQGQPNSQAPAQVPDTGCGSAATGIPAGYELDVNDDLDGAAPAATDMDKDLVRAAVAQAMAAYQQANGIGSVPGGIIDVIQSVPAPSRTPWQRVFAPLVRRCVNRAPGQDHPTYTRRNRRRMNETLRDVARGTESKIIVPGRVKNTPRIHYYRDTSYSMDDAQLARTTAEVIGIANQLGIRGDDLLVSGIDTVVHGTTRFTGAASIGHVSGRGGTEMGEAIAHACSLRRKPNVIIIATDGGTYWPEQRPPIPVIVLLIPHPHYPPMPVPDWAITVEVTSV